MRVCYLLQNAKQTGARSEGTRLGYALADAGHEVMFMVPSPINIDHSEVFVTDGDVYIPTIDLVSAISQANPDVVVAHTITKELIEAMPVIRSMTTTVFRYSVNLTETHIGTGTKFLELYPKFIRMFDAIISPGEHTTHKITSLGIDRRRIYEVNPPIAFEEDIPSVNDRPNTIGVVTRHSPIKNLPFLPRAIRYYEDEYGDAPRVLLAGEYRDKEGKTAPREEWPIVRHAKALSIEHKFYVLGWINPAEVVYPNIRATVLTSLSENFPTVYAESLSLGVPVIAPDAGWAVPPTVYTPDNPASLAHELHTVLEEPGVYYDLQMDAAPEGIDINVATKELEGALMETVERCDRFTLGAEV